MHKLEVANKKSTNSRSTIRFTNDQEKAIAGLIAFCNKEFDNNNFIAGLIGAGGTGKTFITNYIIEHCQYANSVIKCTSSTHKACRVFSQAIGYKKVDTIQSTFGLRLDLALEDFNPDRPQFNPKAKPKLDGIKLLIIDEASMIPAKLITYINKTCKEREIKIIYIGDSSQLPPVNERQSIAFKTTAQNYELIEVVRQELNNPIKHLLDMLRYDIEHKTYHFINYISQHIGDMNYDEYGDGFCILNPQQFKDNIDLSFSDEKYTENIDLYRIIAYTNNCVNSWNNYIRNTIIKDSHKAIITINDLIMSYQTIVNEFNEIVINNSEEYIIKDIVNYTDNKYGFKGFLLKFQMIHGGQITKPLFIIDHTDKFTILQYDKVLSELIKAGKNATGGTRAKKWNDYYDFKKKYLLATNIFKQGKLVYGRDIDYGFAITSHKSQGSTYDTVFVDLNDMIYDKNGNIYGNLDDLLRRLYVACSRASHNLVLCYGR